MTGRARLAIVLGPASWVAFLVGAPDVVPLTLGLAAVGAALAYALETHER